MAFEQCSEELDDIDSCPLTTNEDFLQLCSSLLKVMKDTSFTTAIDNSIEYLKGIKGRVIASNNGLFVCTTTTTIDDGDDSIKPKTKLFLCNPATQTCWLDIQLPNNRMAENYKVIFTCSDSSSFSNNESLPFDYTLLLAELDTSKEWSDEWNVYILEGDKWVMNKTNLDAGGRNLNWNSPVSCKGGLYFISDCLDYFEPGSTNYWPYILCYDVCHGTSTVLPLPDEARDENIVDSNISIFGWQGIRSEPNKSFNSIYLVKCMKTMLWVWVLEDAKDPSSWWRLLKVDIVQDMGIKDSIYLADIRFIITGKNLIFTTDSYVYKYVLEGKDGGELQVICPNSRSYNRSRN